MFSPVWRPVHRETHTLDDLAEPFDQVDVEDLRRSILHDFGLLACETACCGVRAGLG